MSLSLGTAIIRLSDNVMTFLATPSAPPFANARLLRQDIRPQARMLIEPPFLILYEHYPDVEVVEVVAVIDGRRDLRDLF